MEQNPIISEDSSLRKYHEVCSFWCVHVHLAIDDEEHLLKSLSTPYYIAVVRVPPGIHVNHEFIEEPIFTWAEEVVKPLQKVFENELD